MQIAIVAPSPVPFCIGGAENLWWGLLNYINNHTNHQADLIKLPSKERNFWELIDNYKNFSQLDLSHFDLVISSKYPAWMVQHSNHICYMQHRLRGLYDTYNFTGLPETDNYGNIHIAELRRLMRDSKQNGNILQEFFESLDKLRLSSNCPQEAFQFPGSLAREIIHFLDGVALDPSRIKTYAAISYNVANRQNYFPRGTVAEVIYHPSNLKSFRKGSNDYLFTVSRLDNAKRVSLLIQAMKYVKTNIQLKIAGTGPDADSLKQMAENDERIIFLGFVNDQEITDLYADALAVPYIPYDEDYGLVTIEAMMSGKPVLTTIDAGGPNEFVVNGETGYSVLPDPQALAERIDYLCEHLNEAKEMGLTGQKLVSGINWENTVTRLLGETQISKPVSIAKERKKITVALTFPVFPPRGGGQSRVFHLYRHLASQFDIELVTFTNPDEKAFSEEIAPNLYEIRIPKSKEHQQQELLIENKVGVPVTDVAMPMLYHLTPAYTEALKTSIESSDFVVASHPYLFTAIQEVSNKPIYYEAHNIELELKKVVLPKNKMGLKLLETTRKIEADCCQMSKLIMVCSHNDGNGLNRIYDIDLNKIIEVPNGVDLEKVNYISLEKRNLNKVRLGIDKSFTAMFLGSWHPPNLEAVRHIFKMAEKLPHVNFLIVGSVGLAFRDELYPANIGFMGVVDEDTKDVIFGLADVALNPMTYGSGTNLKMLDYFAAGIPVVSTYVGVRGLGVDEGKHCLIVDLEKFNQAIIDVKQENFKSKKIRIETAKIYVQDKFNWQTIAENFSKKIDIL